MKIKQLNEPYVIEMGEDGGRLVQVTIRAVDGGALGYDEIRDATRQITDYTRKEHGPSALTEQTGTVRALVATYLDGHGRVSDEYLARLAVAYEELAPEGRGVSTSLALALDKPLQTVKGHIMRARREGYLSEASEGREGGEATAKSRDLLAEAKNLAKGAKVSISAKSGQ